MVSSLVYFFLHSNCNVFVLLLKSSVAPCVLSYMSVSSFILLLLFLFTCSVFLSCMFIFHCSLSHSLTFLSIGFTLICFSSLNVMFSVFRYVFIVCIHLLSVFLYRSSKMVHKSEPSCSMRCLMYFSFVFMSLAICDDAPTSYTYTLIFFDLFFIPM